MLKKNSLAEKLCDAASRHDQAGNLEEALSVFENILVSYPGYYRALHARGVLLFKTGLAEAGITALQECISTYPEYVVAHHSLGNMYRSQGCLEDALACYDRATSLDKTFYLAYFAKAEILDLDENKLNNAIYNYKRSISINIDFIPAYVGLIKAYQKLLKYHLALDLCNRAIKRSPGNPAILFQLGLIKAEYGEIQSAIECLEVLQDDAIYGKAALDVIQFFINLLPDADQELIYRTAKRFEQKFACPRYPLQKPHIHFPAPDRKLRIGFVSGDFKYHPVARHLAPLVTSMDKSRFELYAYNNFKTQDAMTERLKSEFCYWRDIHDKSVEDSLWMIRNDRIDILIDIAGYTACSGLMLFAERPAPVQISWLGYFNTTGFNAMDYLITDTTTVNPRTEEHFFSEKLLWMPKTRLCYEPFVNLPPIASLPANRTGYVTFGAFTRVNKLNDSVLGAWSEILLQVPDSRLVLKWPSYADKSIRSSVSRRLEALGVGKNRIEFRGHSGYLKLFTEYTSDIDIVLDTFPHSGGGTSCEALFMGVPIITFSGTTPLSRQTHGFLRLIGMEEELVGFSVGEYVEKAVRLANNNTRMDYLRQHLREWLYASPLCDGVSFARNFENLLKVAWHNWCSDQIDKSLMAERSADIGELCSEADRLVELNCFEQAIPYLERGARIDKRNDKILDLLGVCYWECGQLDRAELILRRAKRINPHNSNIFCNLGGVLLERNKERQALKVLNDGPSTGSGHSSLLINKAMVLRKLLKLDLALEAIQTCMNLYQHSAKMYAVRGGINFYMGKLENALADTEKSSDLSSGDITKYSDYLCMLNYDERFSQRDIYENTIKFVSKVSCENLKTSPKAKKKLTIGFISADLHNHPVGFLSLAFLTRYDTEKFRICCYYNGTIYDGITHAINEHSSVWRTVLHCSDSELYRLVKDEDQVDILVDMSGHTSGNRLGVFALRPCPLQISWPGYFNTTGLSSIDYFVSDRYTTPDWMQQFFTEKIVYLPHSRFCYTPMSQMPLVTPLPSKVNGFITFGSFNNISKYSDTVLRCWSKILSAVPGSRLLLKNASFDDRETRKIFLSRLLPLGIERNRIEFRGGTPKYVMLAEYADVDIALDPFPFGGGMTSLDALIMGVPVISCAGLTPVSRQTGSFLHLLGLDELIADNYDEYINKAVSLSNNSERLMELRGNLRNWLMQSPLLDGELFANNMGELIENLYEGLAYA